MNQPRLAQLHQSGATDGQVPVWDDTAGLWVPGTPAAASGGFCRAALTATGGEDQVNLGVTPDTASEQIFVNGTRLLWGTDYTLTAGTATLTTPLTAADVVVVLYSAAACGTATLTTSSGSAYTAAVLADSPIFYLKLDESSGTTAADSSGNGNDFTYQADILLDQGPLIGDGSTSISVATPSPAAILSSVPAAFTDATDFTLEAWVSLTDASRSINFIAIGNGSDGYSLDVNSGTGYDTSGNRLGAAAAGLYNVASGVDIGTGTHHVAVVRNGTAVEFYVDGVQVASNGSAWGSVNTPTTRCVIGGTVDLLEPSQRIAHVAAYATALSSTRIAAHAALG